jgi:hypothetical protein
MEIRVRDVTNIYLYVLYFSFKKTFCIKYERMRLGEVNVELI